MKWSAFFKQICQWPSYDAEMLDESTVIASEAQEAAQILNRLRHRALLHYGDLV
jgi:hypothetical protein